MTMRRSIIFTTVSLMALGLVTHANAFGASVKWAETSGCSGQTPNVTFSAIPKGTAKIDVKMVDLDYPTFNHGGGSVDFTGKTKYEPGELLSMFSTYRGPCPPVGTTHRYEWTFDALDAAGAVLKSAKATIPYKR
jgi:phosphatidylethanolamine-binding protein (PEBP) family uncharacterized protein